MDQDTYDYYVRILERLKDDFDSPEEKESLVVNALSASEEHEVDHCSNQVGSRVIEALIKLAPPSSLPHYMDVFSSNLRVVATNQYAGHVLQALIEVVAKFGLEKLQDDTNEVDGEVSAGHLTAQTANKWVLKVGRFMLNNLDEFVYDDYANYPIRAILLSLAGLPANECTSNQGQIQRQKGHVPVNFSSTLMKTEESDDGQVQAKVILPEGFKELLKEYYERISSLPQFSDLAYTNCTSALLQTLIKALSNVNLKLKKKFIKHIIDQVLSKRTAEESDEDKKDLELTTAEVPPVFTTDASIRLLEAVLSQATSKYVTQVYALCFMGRLVHLATDRATNFAVQRLLACVGDQSEFERIFEEMAPSIDKLIASKFTGVLLSLCQACNRLSVKQGDFIKHLMTALHCMEPNERRCLVTPLILRLCTYEDYSKNSTDSAPVAKDGFQKSVYSLHGSLIVQSLLSFKKPISIVNSLLEIPATELKNIFCDQRASHVMTAFVKSETIGVKSRERMLRKLQGSFVTMACSKYGSYALENLIEVLPVADRKKIFEELVTRHALIVGTPTGKALAGKYALDLFRNRRNEWEQLQNRKERAQDLFADITGLQAS